MNKKESEFNKVFSAWDILVIAFGAMIGWGWVVSTGNWIEKGGVLGAALGFCLGGVMIFFVGLTYAELTAAMPQCGGEHVFSHRAMGPTGSFICTWAIVLGYVSVACFEACAFPTIITYLWPGFLKAPGPAAPGGSPSEPFPHEAGGAFRRLLLCRNHRSGRWCWSSAESPQSKFLCQWRAEFPQK